MYDLAIVGGGPAALTAAVYAARKKLDIVLVAKEIGGQATLTSVVENYMGYQYIEGSELMEKFADQVKQFPITQKVGEGVVNISTLNRSFELKTESGATYQAKAVKGLVQLNDIGEVVVDPYCRTSIPGLFAAGDVTDVPEKQIVVAAGEGSKAALEAQRYLMRLEI